MRTEDDSKRYRNIFITLFSGFEEEITYDKDVNTFQVGYIIISIILVFFGIFGICLNGWAIYLFTKTKTVKNQFNFIVLSIIVSDFFISSIGVTLDLIGAILQGSTLANWLCYFEGPFHTSFGLASLYSISSLAVVRMIVIKNGDNSWLETSNLSFKSTRSLQIIWLLAIILASLPLLGFGQYNQDISNISCLPSWKRSVAAQVIYMWLIAFIGGVIPTVAMVISNVFVLHTLYVHHKASKTGPAQPMLQKQKSFAYREKKVSNRIILMTICFFISWGPYACVYLIPLLSHQNKVPSNIVNVLPLLVAKFGSAVINPLVYVFGNSEFMKDANKSSVMNQSKTAKTNLNMDTSAGRPSKRPSISFSVTEILRNTIALQGIEKINEEEVIED